MSNAMQLFNKYDRTMGPGTGGSFKTSMYFSMCIDIYTEGNTHSNPSDFGSETNTQYECISPLNLCIY